MDKEILSQSQPSSLYMDTSPSKQPDNTYRFAMNGVLLTPGTLQTEGGASNYASGLPANYKVIGSCVIEDEVVLFLTNGTRSEIGLLTNSETNRYRSIVNSGCLNFSTSYLIQSEYKIARGCERIVYFVDSYNNDRQFNIDKPELYYSTTYKTYLDAGGDPTLFGGEKWDCNLFNLAPDYTPGTSRITEILSTGGTLDTGSYYLYGRYKKGSSILTPYFQLSSQFIIIDSDYNQCKECPEGNYNIEFKPEVENALSPTSKSVRFSLTLDTRYDSIEISVLQYKTGDGTTPSAFTSTTLDYTSSSISYLFTGTKVSLLDPEVLLQEPVVWETSSVLCQHDNRLIRGNLKNTPHDWREFQKIVNDVQVTWTTTSIPSEASAPSSIAPYRAGHGYKHPSNYSLKSFLRDEIYALGIVFIFKNGTTSPVFHIPGRELNKASDGTTLPSATDPDTHSRPIPTSGWDSTTYTASGSQEQDLLPFVASGATCPRWKAYNTASFLSIPANQLGYYECEDRYPKILDCDGVPIYPHTFASGVYTMDKIRHHRMPDTTLVPLLSGDDPVSLGLSVSNVTFPSSDVQGWKLVFSKRTDATVIDKGVFEKSIHGRGYIASFTGNPRDNSTTHIAQSHVYNMNVTGNPVAFLQAGKEYPLTGPSFDLQGVINISAEYQSFYSPKPLFQEKTVQGSYVKIEHILSGNIKYLRDDGKNDWYYQKRANKWSLSADERWWCSFLNLSNPTLEARAKFHTNRVMSDPVLLSIDEESSITGSLQYKSYGNQLNQILKTTLDYTGLSNGTLSTEGVEANTSDKGIPPDGQAQSYIYGSVKRFLLNAYSDLSNIYYIDQNPQWITAAQSTFYNGDTFVSTLNVRKTFSYGDHSYGLRPLTPQKGVGKAIDIAGYFIPGMNVGKIIGYLWSGSLDIDRVYIGHLSFITESEVNTDLRQHGELLLRDYNEKTSSDEEDILFNANEYYPRLDINKYLAFPVYAANYHKVNEDLLGIYPKLRTSPSYDYTCTDCLEEFPHTIVYSEISNEDEAGDSYRLFKANSFISLTPKGSITGLYSMQDKIAVLSNNAFRLLVPQPQQLSTNDSTVYLGTGEFMSLPPLTLGDVDYGYAGCQGRQASKLTEYGLFFVDQMNGKVYQFSDNLKEISLQGVSQFLRSNLPSQREDQYFRATKVKYPLSDNSVVTDGVSVHLSYDPSHRRIIIHKRDYLQQTGYQEDKSFNISYSIPYEVWMSFHSWKPSLTFNTARRLFSLPQGTPYIVHEHHFDSYACVYYSTLLPFIVEVIARNSESSDLYSVRWLTNAYSTSGLENKSKTFTNIWAYTDTQSTGLLTLNPATNPYQDLTWSNVNRYIEHTPNQDYRVSKLYDIQTAGTAPSSTLYADTLATYTNYGYIDKVPKDFNLSTTQYDLTYLKDKVHHIRLIFAPQDDIYKLQLELSSIKTQYSIR